MAKDELKKSDIKDEVIRVLDSREFKERIIKIILDEVKKNPDLEKEFVDIVRNVLTQLYKTLWVKREFWRSQLSNKKS